MLSQEKVFKAIEAGVKKAQELDITVTISIFDVNGIEFALYRMGGAFSVSPIFAKAKAVTSATLGLPTAGIAEYAVEGKPYYGIDNLSGGKFTTIAGGLPVQVNGSVVAGVGVGGSSDTSQDVQVAEVVAEELQ